MTMQKIIFSLLVACLCLTATAQTQTAQQIVATVKQHFDEVKDYTVTITASVNMEKMKIPEMKATLYFKQPDKVHIESKSFSMLPREGMGLQPADMLSKYDATLIKSGKRDGVMFYDLRLVSKAEKGKQVREYFVSINGDEWVVSHIESFPMPGRKITIDFTHTLIADQYWLPSTMEVNYTSEQTDEQPSTPSPAPQRGMPRKGTASVRYTDYTVNTGLPDELFEKKNDHKK
jgi:hypothetical protein